MRCRWGGETVWQRAVRARTAPSAVGRWDSIVTLQSGFPLTPQLSYNPSNNGDTRNPVRPFANPNFHGPPVIGSPNKWFNPTAYRHRQQTADSTGTRQRYTAGPGLATWDFAGQKDTQIGEGLKLEFRGEIFNLLNRANFNAQICGVYAVGGFANGWGDH